MTEEKNDVFGPKNKTKKDCVNSCDRVNNKSKNQKIELEL